MRMIQEMGREWEGIGRGIRSRPPNIPPYPPHTMCVGGRGDKARGSIRIFLVLSCFATRPPFFSSKVKRSLPSRGECPVKQPVSLSARRVKIF